jgi:hypothetical protein
MNLNTAGSGFLQMLQLLTLFYSRRGKATLFLLDEPEAHLESIRQQDLYRLLAERAEVRWTPSFRPRSTGNKMDFRSLLSFVFLFVYRSLCASKPF